MCFLRSGLVGCLDVSFYTHLVSSHLISSHTCPVYGFMVTYLVRVQLIHGDFLRYFLGTLLATRAYVCVYVAYVCVYVGAGYIIV